MLHYSNVSHDTKAPENSFWLAPMRGLTLRPYRAMLKKYFGGVHGSVSPFIPTIKGPRIKPRLLRDVLPSPQDLNPMVPQILGRSPDDIRTLIRALADAGHEVVNWNLGCPSPTVRRHKRGAGMLAHKDLLMSVLDQILKDAPARISIKIRLGVDDVVTLQSLLPALNRRPIESLIVHPRTAEQLYTGRPDLDAFATVLEHTTHTVMYSGDIYCPADLQELKRRFPHQRLWMLGRGLMVNPMLGRDLAGQSLDHPIERIRDFQNELLDGYLELFRFEAAALGHMKELWSYLHRSFEGGEQAFVRIRRQRMLRDYCRETRAFFDSNPAWRPPQTSWIPGAED